MEPRRINDKLTVSGQIAPADVPALKEQGFVAIMCNRPDEEEPGQYSADEIRAAAEANGLAFYHIPTQSGVFPPDVVDAFRAARQEAGGPVFAYCRTGTRCATLDALANPDRRPAEEILQSAAAAGYDLSPLSERIVSP